MDDFALDPQIEADSIGVADLPLCTVRLMRDSNYPWLVLVPRRPALAEIIDLQPEDRTRLMAEIAAASEALRMSAGCDKLNVAALGNMVRQLHIHVIARRSNDPAWPKPVWGAAPPKPYETGAAEALAETIAANLA